MWQVKSVRDLLCCSEDIDYGVNLRVLNKYLATYVSVYTCFIIALDHYCIYHYRTYCFHETLTWVSLNECKVSSSLLLDARTWCHFTSCRNLMLVIGTILNSNRSSRSFEKIYIELHLGKDPRSHDIGRI